MTTDAAGFVGHLFWWRRVGIGLSLTIGEWIFGCGSAHARGDEGAARLGRATRRLGGRGGSAGAIEIAANFLRGVADVEDAIGNVHPFGFDEQLFSGLGVAGLERGARSQEQAIDTIARSFASTVNQACLPELSGHCTSDGTPTSALDGLGRRLPT